MRKLTLCLLLVIISTTCTLAQTTFLNDLSYYEHLFTQGEYRKVLTELKPKIEVFEESGTEDDIDLEKYISARNLVSDCYLIEKDYYNAYMWFGLTTDMYLDPYAIYCSKILSLSTIYKGIDRDSPIEQDKYTGWLGNHPSLYDSLWVCLNQLLRDAGLPKKLEFFYQMVQYDQNNNWVTYIIKFCAGFISLNELTSFVPKDHIGVAKTFAGLYYECMGDLLRAKKMYLEVLDMKEFKGIESLLAANRLGKIGFYIVFKEGNQEPIKLTSFITLETSSTLLQYPANNLVDGNPNTTWVEGVQGNGINEWIAFTINPEENVRLIKINNGYSKNKITYYENNRLKRIRVEFDDGSLSEYELQDGILEPQIIELPIIKKCREIKISILDVYIGSKYADTCISEITFE